MRKLLVCVGFAALLAACGDNHMSGDDTPDIDAAAGPDAAVPDAMVEPDAYFCSAFDPGAPGGTCDEHADCDSAGGAGDGYCLSEDLSADLPAEGYCTIDNGGTACVTDEDCGERGQCIDTDGYKWCLAECCMFETCPSGQACFTSFQGFALDRPSCVPGDSSAEDGDPCSGIADCNQSSLCRGSVSGTEFPGGQCWTFGCTIGDDSTCNGGHCIVVDDYPTNGNHCADTCDSDADCRMSEGYVCFDPDGDAGDAQEYCRHPQAGDECTTAEDCGGGAWICQTGADFPNGYCTTTGCPTGSQTSACGTNAICHDDTVLGQNYCVDRCPTVGQTTGCRAGYTCTDVGAATGGGCLAL